VQRKVAVPDYFFGQRTGVYLKPGNLVAGSHSLPFISTNLFTREARRWWCICCFARTGCGWREFDPGGGRVIG
jgi:hypothetical protein